MFNDIDACIKGRANFAAALVLSAYTEILGGLTNGTLTERKASGSNYRVFLARMGYSPEECSAYYDSVRCGLVHQYFIKGNQINIGMSTPVLGTKGLRDAFGVISFIIESYVAEFKKAYFTYKAELLLGEGLLPANFDKALGDETVPVAARADASIHSLGASTISTDVTILVPEFGPMPPRPKEEHGSAL